MKGRPFNLSAPNDESQPKPFQNAKESLTLHFHVGSLRLLVVIKVRETLLPEWSLLILENRTTLKYGVEAILGPD
jgi:hypothetical protein